MRTSFLILTFVLAALGSVAAAALMMDRIETTSRRAVETTFLEERMDWVEVAVDGLQVQLSGTAPDEATRFKALTLAGTVVDATQVIDAMSVAPGKVLEPPAFSVEILRNDAGVSLIGLAPGAMDREAVTALLDGIAGAEGVTDLMETADYPAPAGWAPAMAFALDALAELPRSKISVAPGRVSITAISESPAQKKQLEAELYEALPPGVEMALDISAPRPVITPFTLRFLIDGDGARFDACSAHTEEGRRKILAAAKAAGLDAGECRLGLGVPSPRWPDAVSEGIAAVAKLGAGSVTFSDADVTLAAAAPMEQRTFDRVVGELEAVLPEVFSLSAVMPERAKVDASGAPVEEEAPEFVATLSPEGLLQLRGRVTDGRQRDAVEGFAMARFSTAEVHAAMRGAEGLPPGWAGRVFAGLEALSYLSRGALLVQPDFVELRGETSDPEAKEEIARILGGQLGDRGTFSIEVVYNEIVEPVQDLPTPIECVTQINAVLGEKKITFAPGSAEIDSAARGTLDRIAEIMHDCTAVPMEIAGHTDSQGRETMNLGLSQRRAEAVLEALMARRVLVANLTAKGYGEALPIAGNDTEAGREANRRIEFTLRLRETAAAEDGDVETAGADGEAAAEDGAGDGDAGVEAGDGTDGEAGDGTDGEAGDGTDGEAGAAADGEAGDGTDDGAEDEAGDELDPGELVGPMPRPENVGDGETRDE